VRADWLVVGAGFTGAVVAEQIASRLDQSVIVIDRRDHIGGNAYDTKHPSGVVIHRYGPHIFHTNAQRIWEYLSRFTTWRPYEHRVLAEVDGLLVPVPFNLESLALLLPAQAAQLERKLVGVYGPGASVPVLELRQTADRDVRRLADFIYEKLFLKYTEKQWGLSPRELDPSVTGRVPVRISRDSRYFLDAHQAMPAEGYARLFERLLGHPSITVRLGVQFPAPGIKAKRIVYTGPIDEFFGFVHGPLAYRSLNFDFREFPQSIVQPAATINYPDERPYTRSTELKYLTGQKSSNTVLVYEYPLAHVPGSTEPYYPIPRQDHRELHRRYLSLASSLRGKVWFGGRLADYRYYNMDQAVARGLALFKEITGQGKAGPVTESGR